MELLMQSFALLILATIYIAIFEVESRLEKK